MVALLWAERGGEGGGGAGFDELQLPGEKMGRGAYRPRQIKLIRRCKLER